MDLMSNKRCEDCDCFQPTENMETGVCLADEKYAAYPLILDDGKQTDMYGWCGGEKWEGWCQ